MISPRMPLQLSGVAMGLLLIVLVSMAVVPLAGSDDEPIRGAVTRSDETGTDNELVELEIGSDELKGPKGPAAESDRPTTKNETPDASTPGMSKAKVFRGDGNKSKKSSTSGTDRGMLPPGGPGNGRDRGMAPPGGGGRMGMGKQMGMSRTQKLYLEGGNVILKQSDDGTTLWGYSEKLGKWTRLTIRKGNDLLMPIVGVTVGVFYDEERVYAYSASTGRWGELKTTAVPTVAFHKVTVQDQDRVYIFSDVSGRWASNTDAADNQPAGSPPGVTIDSDTSSDAARPNSFVDAAGRMIELGDFDSEGRLDVIFHPAAGEPPGTNTNFGIFGHIETVTPESAGKMNAADLLESYQARYRESEREATKAAAEYRIMRQRQGAIHSLTVSLQSILARRVQESFELRQQAQRLEAEILRRRLHRVDQRLDDRERLKDQIIQHRLEELQNSSVRWEAEPDDQARRREQPARSRFESPARIDLITPFVGRGRWAVDVGVVSNVTDDGWIKLSPKETSGIRVGDELEVNRPDLMRNDGTRQRRRFAHVFVVKAEPEVAFARIVESTRVLLNNKYVWDPTLTGDSVARPDAVADKKALIKNKALVDLQGQWLCVSQNDENRETPSAVLEELRRTLFITGDRMRLVYLSDGDLSMARRFTVDANHVPHHLDFAVTDDKPQKQFRNTGIYQIDGHTLRICLGKTRPTEFKAGPDVYFCTYELQTSPQQASPPATPPDSPEGAGVNPLSGPVIDVVTVRELLADTIPLEFAVLDPPEQDPPFDTKVRRQQAVCLRGVFPWPELAARLAASVKNYPYQKPTEVVDIRDFKIERQESIGTPSTWDNIPWNDYAVSKSLDVLQSCEKIDNDLIQEAERSVAITCPLPHLLQGIWDERVLHPRLKENGLPPAPLRTSTDDERARAAVKGDTARYVLFRFLDFDTTAGRSYRYRVKLEFEGPLTPDLDEGPWSEPSTVAVVVSSP